MDIQDINGLVKVLHLEENSNAELNAEMGSKLKVSILSTGPILILFSDGSPKKMKCLGKQGTPGQWKVRPKTFGHVIECVPKKDSKKKKN